MNVQGVGSYIRRQREASRLSLSKVSGLAGVSIPYLSQVERGLRRPSADILQAIAKALRISAETLYVQAGILEARPAGDVPAAIMSDPVITLGQKRALIQIYEAFLADAESATEPEGPAPATAPAAPASRPRSTRGSTATTTTSSAKPGERAKTPDVRGPHPATLRPPATSSRKEV
jgi:transcriptional regulator with XRE-family HTH domain